MSETEGSITAGKLAAVSEKKTSRPAWYKNTYFWIAGILLILGLLGLVMGDNVIRDPGQKRESGLALMYFAAAVIMFLNGWLSHRQTVQHYKETLEGAEK